MSLMRISVIPERSHVIAYRLAETSENGSLIIEYVVNQAFEVGEASGNSQT